MKRETEIYLKGLKGAFYLTAGMLGILFLITFINILIEWIKTL